MQPIQEGNREDLLIPGSQQALDESVSVVNSVVPIL